MSNQYLVIHMTDRDGSALPEGEDRRLFVAWSDKGVAEDRILEGAPVAAAEEAKSVAIRDGNVLITDGPFPEFKEWIAGYDLITADSIDEAAAFMAGHPSAAIGRIYILPTVKLAWETD